VVRDYDKTRAAFLALSPCKETLMQNCFHAVKVTVTFKPRDLLRPRYWVRCWQCELHEGPFTHRDADHRAHAINLAAAVDPALAGARSPFQDSGGDDHRHQMRRRLRAGSTASSLDDLAHR
jgi:hypothetical protein